MLILLLLGEERKVSKPGEWMNLLIGGEDEGDEEREGDDVMEGDERREGELAPPLLTPSLLLNIVVIEADGNDCNSRRIQLREVERKLMSCHPQSVILSL